MRTSSYPPIQDREKIFTKGKKEKKSSFGPEEWSQPNVASALPTDTPPLQDPTEKQQESSLVLAPTDH